MFLRGLSGLNLVSADVVEVSPAYDHAEVTSLQLQQSFTNLQIYLQNHKERIVSQKC